MLETQLGELFVAVQLSHLFPDSKTFVDCTPKRAYSIILEAYRTQKIQPDFDLKAFVEAHFEMPQPYSEFKHDTKNPREHIRNLWQVLTRKPDTQQECGTLLPLPHSYIVPGGRFGEIYYWDSYFTMLGLQADGEFQRIRDMVANFAYLIEELGHIPNGNREYYRTRSQPPFFAFMVKLLAEIDGEAVLRYYESALRKEYAFWMNGIEKLSTENPAHRRVVRIEHDGNVFVLNRYWDDCDTPRTESYREDVEIAEKSGRAPSEIYRHLRAGAESGWDFSSRWFTDPQDISTICTTDLLPIDLNVLLWHLENLLAEIAENPQEKVHFAEKAQQRKIALSLFWKDSFFHDFHWQQQKTTAIHSLAGVLPLFCGIASVDQAQHVTTFIETHFLKDGGVISTLETTSQQWDAPNGWAPLQWMTVQGLRHYGYDALANTIQARWLALNDSVFAATGKMMEKYNVADISLIAGGGEYPNQDGFGWTNGVYQAMRKMAR